MNAKKKTLKKAAGRPIVRRNCSAGPHDATRPGWSGVASRRRQTLLASLLLVLMTLALYAPAARYPFINFDDYSYVKENHHVQAGLTWKTVIWSLSTMEQSNWHPLTWLSHALDCQIFGLNPIGHHVTSIWMHAVNASMLFVLLLRVSGLPGRSFLVSSLFALHPLNVESVVWVAERKNVLSTLFFLLALGAYGWYAKKPGVKRYLVLVLFFVLGLTSKPMLVTLPCVLCLIDFWPLGRIKKLHRAYEGVSCSAGVPRRARG